MANLQTKIYHLITLVTIAFIANLTLKHFTLTEYHQLAKLGIIGEDDRVEMIAKGTAHEVCITRLIRKLAQVVGDRAIRRQSPITFNHSEL